MGACLLLFSTTIVCCVNKKRGINHHCRLSQVLDGTRIFANFADDCSHGHRISPVGVIQISPTAPGRFTKTLNFGDD